MIEYVQGDIFESPAQALVNPVNCMGVAGKGLAKEFKKRYPESFEDYRRSCETGILKPGCCSATLEKGKWIVSLATKDHWLYNSQYIYIRHGLQSLLQLLKIYQVNTVALPALGCGNGRLEWKVVNKMMEEYLTDTPGITFDIYPPQ